MGLPAGSTAEVDAEEFLRDAGRFLKASRGFVVLRVESMSRVLAGIGPALGCLLLKGEKREWGSITGLVQAGEASGAGEGGK